MKNTTRSARLPHLIVGCLLFTVGFVSGRYYPQLEAWTAISAREVPPASVPGEPKSDSPRAEARSVLEQLGRRLRELQAREQQLQRTMQEDQVAYQILRSQNRCDEDDACRRLQDRRQRSELELTETRAQVGELVDLEKRVREVMDRADSPTEEPIDPALVAARALLLRVGEDVSK